MLNTKNKILFYHQNEKPYGVFSNFAKYPIKINDKDWPTSEHFFQAMKFQFTEHEELIRLAKTPMIAAKMGRDRNRPLRPDWEQIKDNVMRLAVKVKFNKYPELAQILIDTGKAELIEHTKNDFYWGDGGNGTGKNMLGKILMEERDFLEKYNYEILEGWTYPILIKSNLARKY